MGIHNEFGGGTQISENRLSSIQPVPKATHFDPLINLSPFDAYTLFHANFELT